MKKPVIIVSILLIITLGLLWYIKMTIESTTSATIPELKSENKLVNLLKITFFDVGQGDASFIEFPNGEQMLVDCALDARILEALGRVMPYYDRDLDYLVISHPDADHYAGCIDVLKNYQVKNIVYNGLKKESDKLWQWFWDLVQAENAVYHEISEEEVWNIGGTDKFSKLVPTTTIHFYYPNHPVKDLIKTDLYKNYNGNNLSIIMGLNYNNHQALFTGDAEADLEKYLISNFNDQLKSAIIKIGHHGSAGSSNKDFLFAVKPSFAIISVGENRYGHPSERVLKKLERAEAKIFRTDENGDITCEVGEKVECKNNEQ